MPFNPNFPTDDELLVGPPFRDQFNSLNDDRAALAARVDAQDATIASQAATIAELLTRLQAVEAHISAEGDWLGNGVNVSGSVVAGGALNILGRWQFFAVGNNLSVVDANTGNTAYLTNFM